MDYISVILRRFFKLCIMGSTLFLKLIAEDGMPSGARN